MTRYELKDKERQEAFTKAIPDFMSALQRAGNYGTVNGAYIAGILLSPKMNTPGEWKIVFRADEVEAIQEYDPNAWNEFPRVTPPENVWMRVETWNACGATVRGVFMYTGGAWRRSKYTAPNDEIKTARFRPWYEVADK